jgi:hypothetical protein
MELDHQPLFGSEFESDILSEVLQYLPYDLEEEQRADAGQVSTAVSRC